jgi:hypothetical protein
MRVRRRHRRPRTLDDARPVAGALRGGPRRRRRAALPAWLAQRLGAVALPLKGWATRCRPSRSSSSGAQPAGRERRRQRRQAGAGPCDRRARGRRRAACCAWCRPTLEDAPKRRFSPVHVAARLAQVDDLLARARPCAPRLRAALLRPAGALAGRLWLPPELATAWCGAHMADAGAASALAPLQAVRERFRGAAGRRQPAQQTPPPVVNPAPDWHGAGDRRTTGCRRCRARCGCRCWSAPVGTPQARWPTCPALARRAGQAVSLPPAAADFGDPDAGAAAPACGELGLPRCARAPAMAEQLLRTLLWHLDRLIDLQPR